MKFRIDRQDFDRAIAIAEKVCGKGPQDLRWIGVETSGSTVVVSATDSKRFVSVALSGVDVSDPGEAWFPAEILAKVVAKLPDGDIDFSDQNDRFLVKADGAKAKLPSRAEPLPFEFPFIEEPEAYLDMLPSEFEEAIAFISGTIAAPDKAQNIQGVNISRLQRDEGEGCPYVFASTDSNCLAVVNWPGSPKYYEGAESVSVDDSFLDAIHFAIANDDCIKFALAIGEVTAEATLEFARYSLTVSGRIFAGDYFPYQRIVPTEFNALVHFEAPDLHKALDRVSVFADCKEGLSLVEFHFLVEEGVVEIVNLQKQHGEMSSTFPAEFDGIPPRYLCFQSQYIKKAVKQKGELTLSIVDFKSIAAFTPPGEVSPMLLVMPVVPPEVAAELAEEEKRRKESVAV